MKNTTFTKIVSSILLLMILLNATSASAATKSAVFPSDNNAFSVVVTTTATSLNKTLYGGNTYGYTVNITYNVSFTGTVPAGFSFYNFSGLINTSDGQTGFQLANPNGIGTVSTYMVTRNGINDFATSTPASVGATEVIITVAGPGLSQSSKVTSLSALAPLPGASTGAPLPATVKSFSATPSTEGVVLSWETAEETQVQSFTIEHSPNGAEWKPVGTVAAKGGSASGASYTLTDGVNAAANSYYRLSESDLNGNITYYKTVIVRNAQVQVTPQLFPNPNTGNTIHLTGLESQGRWQLSVIGADAQSKGTFPVSEGSVTLPELSAGLYFLSLRNAVTGAVSTFRYSKL